MTEAHGRGDMGAEGSGRLGSGANRRCVEVAIWRGQIRESLHCAVAAEVDSAGRLLSSVGDAEFTTSFRSAAKPLQAAPLFTAPGAPGNRLNDEELAICCASHAGEPRQTALAASVLALSGYLPDDLVCGRAAWPESPLRHGCSGNHAAILLLACAIGAPLEGYEQPAHPAQQAIRQHVLEMAGETPLAGMDGCGIPTFGLPLSAMARSFAALIRPGAPWERIPAAMAAHADLIGAGDWPDVRIMQATPGRIIAKTGADGLLCLADRASGRAIAIKVIDGAYRALGPAAVAILRDCGWLSEPELAALSGLAEPEIYAASGEPAARIQASPTT